MRQISLQGHRGARGLLPENTLPSLIKPFEYGMDGIEFDVQLSQDNQVVIYHDLNLDATITRDQNGDWVKQHGHAIHSLTLKQLKQYKLGMINRKSVYGLRFRDQTKIADQTIPTLSELVECLKDKKLSHALLNIEIKHSPLHPGQCPSPALIAQKVVEEIFKLGIDRRCIVQSFNWAVVKEVKKIAPALPVSCLSVVNRFEDTISPVKNKPSPWTAGLNSRDFDNLPQMVAELGADYWSPYFKNLQKDMLEIAHQKGLMVMVWTVNHKSSMRRLINWGVDGIISDYPDKLAQVNSTI